MAKQSAGILVYREVNGFPEVLLVHPGGPYFAKKDAGVWSIPKGEFTDEEEPLAAAKREFEEELGMQIDGDFVPLNPVKQRSGKMVYAWALAANPDISSVTSNTCTIEWPPKSGKQLEIPEVDRAEWLTIEDAMTKINPGQVPLLIELQAMHAMLPDKGNVSF